MLFALQRLSALVMAPFVLIHLGLILYAIRGGLTADEILTRVQGSSFWPLFYGLFVVSVAVHAPIGLRTILREWTRFPGKIIDPLMVLFAGLLLVLGARAVLAVTGAMA